LSELESKVSLRITVQQIQAILRTLSDDDPGQTNYERARQIARNIFPDDFERLMGSAQEEPFVSNQLLQERLVSITKEIPEDFSVQRARVNGRINDWAQVLKNQHLTAENLSEIMNHCERIVVLMPLRLTQETNDNIGAIVSILSQIISLIEQTNSKLIRQEVKNKAEYAENLKKLYQRGHYFANYFGALSYMSAMLRPKTYIYNFHNGKDHYDEAGKLIIPEIHYTLWHWLTAVPAMERHAESNLGLFLQRLNIQDKLTPKQYYALLKPAKIDSSAEILWSSVRKPVSTYITVFLFLASLVSLVLSSHFTLFTLCTSSLGFVSIPLAHYGFAIIGWIITKRDINRLHQRIDVLEKSWDALAEINPSAPESLVDNSPVEIDYGVQGPMVTWPDVKRIAHLADLSGIQPVQLPQMDRELEILFGGSDRFEKPIITIMPDDVMFTLDGRRFSRPVRLGNRIFVSQTYFDEYNRNFPAFLCDIAHEVMVQWIQMHRPKSNKDAHKLALSLAAVVEVNLRNQYSDFRGRLAQPESVISTSIAPGGIDLRAINFTVKNIASTAVTTNELNIKNSVLGDGAEQELAEINRLLKAKIIPSSERLKECLRKIPVPNQESYIKQINNCLAEIFMLEEEYAQPSEASFVDLLQTVVLNK